MSAPKKPAKPALNHPWRSFNPGAFKGPERLDFRPKFFGKGLTKLNRAR